LLQFGYVTFLLVDANKVILYMCSIEYRQLAFLREKFKVGSIPGLKHQIPIMALTATATPRVRDDILKSLGIATGKPKIVLHFSVSRTEDYLTLTI
jgi:superfamily II DNA helicase RecQ